MSVSAFFPSALWLSFHIFPFSLSLSFRISHSLSLALCISVHLYFYFYSLSCNNQAQESNKWMNNNNVNGKFNELAFIKFCWYAYDHWIFIARNLVMLNWGCQHLWTTISVKYMYICDACAWACGCACDTKAQENERTAQSTFHGILSNRWANETET